MMPSKTRKYLLDPERKNSIFSLEDSDHEHDLLPFPSTDSLYVPFCFSSEEEMKQAVASLRTTVGG